MRQLYVAVTSRRTTATEYDAKHFLVISQHPPTEPLRLLLLLPRPEQNKKWELTAGAGD